MNIYDDDIKIINNEIYYKEEKLGLVLKRAKKVEELLRLYQNNFNIDDVYTSDKNRMKELREEIK